MTRKQSGFAAALTGALLNLLLFGGKLFAGLYTGSVAIRADAFNNLGDSASSLVSLIGLKMSRKKPDKEHPFGHGRIEYITALVVALLVLWVGVDFFTTSVRGLRGSERAAFRLPALLILIISLFVKLFMALMYRRTAQKTKSMTMKAAALDSFSDMLITAITMAALVLSRFSSFPFDAVCGLAVSVFIIVSAVKMIGETTRPILGAQADTRLSGEIVKLLLSDDKILGVHDLVLHDYGPDHVIASVHAEMPQDMSFFEVHSVFHHLEEQAQKSLSVELVIHGDPVDTTDPDTQILRYALKSILSSLDKGLGYHDLQLFPVENNVQVSLDLVVPYVCAIPQPEIEAAITRELTRLNPKYTVSCRMDRV